MMCISLPMLGYRRLGRSLVPQATMHLDQTLPTQSCQRRPSCSLCTQKK